MLYLSVLSFIASILYFHVGFRAIRFNWKSELCRIFFLLTVSMTIWSFANGFLYLAKNVYEYSYWNKVSAFGWCTFEALVLYFVLVLIENKHIRYWYIKLIIMTPAIVFLYMALFLFGPDIHTKPWIETVFYVGNFLYNFSYLAVGIFLIVVWGKKAKSKLQKKQASIIAITSIIPFLLNLISQQILPQLNIISLPGMGQIFTLIMLFGVNYAIMKYQFMSIPSSLVTNELFNELSGITLLVDSQGIIMKANKQSFELLGYTEYEILGKHIDKILLHDDINDVILHCDTIKERMKFCNIEINTKSGVPIPFDISLIPLFTSKQILGGVLFIGEDIRVTRNLVDEITRHRITNIKLQNSELMFRKILEIAPVSIALVSKNTGQLVYLNSQAEELFGERGAGLIGIDIFEFFVNKEDWLSLKEKFMIGEKISNNAIQMIKKDGSSFPAMITIIPSIYNDLEVALSCIIDMTEQKKIEEQLKQNNEYIHKLNKDLVFMNTDLMNKSIKDGLTNLYNHQYINEVLENKLKEISASKESLCLMMMDIDYFKRVNDKYGHLVGDKVLMEVSQLVKHCVRPEDCIGRYGGEEFLVILSDITLEQAVRIAKNILENVYKHHYGIESLKVSISIGVVQYEGEAMNAFINRADMLLYQAKANGRNRVESVLNT